MLYFIAKIKKEDEKLSVPIKKITYNTKVLLKSSKFDPLITPKKGKKKRKKESSLIHVYELKSE